MKFCDTKTILNVQSTLDSSKLKGPAFNTELSRVLNYQEFQLTSLMLKKFELLSLTSKLYNSKLVNIKLYNSNCSVLLVGSVR